MILSELRDYLKANRRAGLADMALHFNVESGAIRGMLEQWIRKGKVRKLPSGTLCGDGCCKCDPETVELYEWMPDGARATKHG